MTWLKNNRIDETGRNIDYLEIKLFWQDIRDKLIGICENSLKRIVKTDYDKYTIQFRAKFSEWLYIIYDIYIEQIIEDKIKDVMVWSINWIKNTNLSKNWVFLTFSWEFWNEYSLLNFMDFIDWIKYNYNKYMWAIYRLDYKIDVFNVTVDETYSMIDKTKFNVKNIPCRRDLESNELTYYTLNFCEDLIRIYNKKLDIFDKWKQEKYQDIIKYDWPVTRIEVQLSRKKFARKLIKDIFDLFEYGESALIKKMKKYYKYEIFKDEKLKQINFDITKNIILRKEREVLNFNKIMYNSYLKKLLDKKWWIKFLKKSWYDVEKIIFCKK